jgi:hypothetical protein
MMMERYPNLKKKVGGSNPSCEISSVPNGKLAMWLTTSCALALACPPFVSIYVYLKEVFNNIGKS